MKPLQCVCGGSNPFSHICEGEALAKVCDSLLVWAHFSLSLFGPIGLSFRKARYGRFALCLRLCEGQRGFGNSAYLFWTNGGFTNLELEWSEIRIGRNENGLE